MTQADDSASPKEHSKVTAESQLRGELPGQSSTQLHIGDTVAFCAQRNGKFCFIGSEGFVELGCSLRNLELASTVPWTHVDCLWVVTQKHQYDAQKSLHRYRKAKRRGSALDASQNAEEEARAKGKGKTQGGASFFANLAESAMSVASSRARVAQEAERREHMDLITALRNERLSNITRNEEKRGMPVTYGETVQLMHLKSKKYMVFHPKRRSQSLGCCERLPERTHACAAAAATAAAAAAAAATTAATTADCTDE